MRRFCFGVDIGGTTVKIGFFTTDGNLVEQWEIPTDKSDGGENILTDIECSVATYLAKSKIDADDIEGIGLGLPGPVTSDGMVLNCVNLGWGTFNIEKKASNVFHGLPVWVANDANVAALGEFWAGGGKEFLDMIMITLGTGVGGGIIMNGKIVSGYNGSAGEIGHMFVNDNETRTCNCGRKGCLEQVTSATGIVNIAKDLLLNKTQDSRLREISNFTAKDVFDMAKENDCIALKTIEIMTDYLSTAMSNIASVINPQAFVIGGGVSKAGEFLIDMLRKKYYEKAFPACKKAEIVSASLGNDAGIYGCAALVVNK